MKERKLRIAIVSDLHCHPEDTNNHKNNATVLFTDKLRDISKQHPVENLKELKIHDKIEDVDILLCPGDFTNQSHKQGLISGWDFINEISEILQAKKIYATIGNHDIDSRNKFSNYSFTYPRGIKKNFPLCNNDIGDFWSKGFTFIEQPQYQILVVNSTHFHTHSTDNPVDNPNVKGKIEEGGIEEIEKYLRENNDNSKIKIMLCHHHPKQHSRNGLGEHDFIENGEDLLNVLGRYSFDLIVHGHKHDPWFGNYPTTDGYKIPILSSGSFSATSQISYCYKVNYFHIVEISKQTETKGTIKTWNFKNKQGWSIEKDGFEPLTGFGNKQNIDLIIEDVDKFICEKPKVEWIDLLDNFNDLKYLLPEEMKRLISELKLKGYSLTENKESYPEYIFNNKLLSDKYGC